MSLSTKDFFGGKIKTISSIIHEDKRGFFREIYNRNDFLKIGITDNFVQDNFSFSIKKGVIRGLHYQRSPYSEQKILYCLKGKIFDVLVDVRKSSNRCVWTSGNFHKRCNTITSSEWYFGRRRIPLVLEI